MEIYNYVDTDYRFNFEKINDTKVEKATVENFSPSYLSFLMFFKVFI